VPKKKQDEVRKALHHTQSNGSCNAGPETNSPGGCENGGEGRTRPTGCMRVGTGSSHQR
jgi:hypothetical protein